MIKQLFVVPNLTVKVITGESCYPHESGFSAICAEVALEDSALAKKVADAQKGRQVVTFRCAMLDVSGKITKSRLEGAKTVFILSIEDLEYRKPAPISIPTTHV